MLDFDPARPGATPRDAATLVVVRDASAGAGGLEVFCVERQKVGFLGGAVVFPGGKLDASDLDQTWRGWTTPPRPPRTSTSPVPWAPDDATLRGLAIAACREALEEAAILPVAGGTLTHAELLGWRARLAGKDASLRELLEGRGLSLDLASIHPFARWITPTAESRRFDARFYLYAASSALTGAHDDHETTASFWASPREVLRRFAAGELLLAPPTHRMLEILAAAGDATAALAGAAKACLDPICPRLVTHRDDRGETMALALRGDPEHEVREPRAPGKSRYVLRGDRFLPEDAPA